VPSAPAAGWVPADTATEPPAPQPVARPTTPAEPTFSSYTAPAVSSRVPDTSWTQQQIAQRFGVTGTSAVVALRRGGGVAGGLAFRVRSRGETTFAFRAAHALVTTRGGRLYRIGTWLRSDVPGLTVCLRIQEMSARDAVAPVRTSESCFAPTATWKHFRVYRRTLARGNRLVFSIYAYGATDGDSFDVDRFTVSRRVTNLWKRVDAVFGDADLR
jgi:hypothetical protein